MLKKSQFLKYMGGVKGEKIWKAAYNVVNQWEEVRAESLTLTKSLTFVSEMLQNIQNSLKASGHPPTALLYTDSPQSMCIAFFFLATSIMFNYLR